MTQKHIEYPYLPEGVEIVYVPADNHFMQAAKDIARKASLDITMPTGSVVVKNGKIIGRGANGSKYHQTHVCERARLGIPTGQGYELCEGCHPKNHSEPKAIVDALQHADTLEGSSLYLWGHWWCCEPCWEAMLGAGIHQVVLMEDSEKLFNKNHPENIVGNQFA
ncbi:MAG TPA: deaminase [Candidatus Saccharimonadales bacterium]|nr:deaminase [Candidatus Saccharimonadales bacterium]